MTSLISHINVPKAQNDLPKAQDGLPKASSNLPELPSNLPKPQKLSIWGQNQSPKGKQYPSPALSQPLK